MRLKKGNVERITEPGPLMQRLLSEGYERIDRPDGPGAPAGQDAGPDRPLGEMTVEQLRALAKEKGIGGYSSLAKQDLLELLEGVV